jgi:hypothetical protein
MTVSVSALADLDSFTPDWTGWDSVEWVHKFGDKTSLYRIDDNKNLMPLTQTQALIGAQAGDEGRAILNTTSIWFENKPWKIEFDTPMWFPINSEVTAAQDGLYIPGAPYTKAGFLFVYDAAQKKYINCGADGVVDATDNLGNPLANVGDVYFIDGNGDSPNVRIWLDDKNPSAGADTTDPYPAAPTPLMWSDVGGAAAVNPSYAGVTDGTQIMTGEYKPLFVDLNGDHVKQALEPIQAYFDTTPGDGDPTNGIPCVYMVDSWDPNSPGDAHGWIEVDQGSGYLADLIHSDIFGPGYDMYLQADLTGATWPGTDDNPNDIEYVWQASNDPALYAAPEPASMLLFGTAMVGAVAAYRKRRKK